MRLVRFFIARASCHCGQFDIPKFEIETNNPIAMAGILKKKFKKLQEAKDHIAQLNGRDKTRSLIITRQISSKGTREFFVCDQVLFLDQYLTLPDRHYYELMHRYTGFYFDMEFKTERNSAENGHLYIVEFKELFVAFLKEVIDLHSLNVHCLAMTSCNAEKFSKHLIFNATSVINDVHHKLLFDASQSFFKSFYKTFHEIIRAKTRTTTGGPPPEANNRDETWRMLLDKLPDIMYLEDVLTGKELQCVDMAVYTAHQNFRLFESSKLGDDRTLKRDFNLSDLTYCRVNDRGFLKHSLISYVPEAVYIVSKELIKDDYEHFFVDEQQNQNGAKVAPQSRTCTMKTVAQVRAYVARFEASARGNLVRAAEVIFEYFRQRSNCSGITVIKKNRACYTFGTDCRVCEIADKVNENNTIYFVVRVEDLQVEMRCHDCYGRKYLVNAHLSAVVR